MAASTAAFYIGGIPAISGPAGTTLTVAPTQRVHGGGEIPLAVVNQGRLVRSSMPIPVCSPGRRLRHRVLEDTILRYG
jgi:hypothetical protein